MENTNNPTAQAAASWYLACLGTNRSPSASNSSSTLPPGSQETDSIPRYACTPSPSCSTLLNSHINRITVHTITIYVIVTLSRGDTFCIPQDLLVQQSRVLREMVEKVDKEEKPITLNSIYHKSIIRFEIFRIFVHWVLFGEIDSTERCWANRYVSKKNVVLVVKLWMLAELVCIFGFISFTGNFT
jgi:hypothetical protein